ncbi:MAG TPA: hypothetical protein VGS18_03035, partial [Thermoplasmata archaeon]|nr:hypothetical protein [Thermoplasmata archaeon]
IADALEGRYFDAMARNSAAIESALNYAYGPLRQRMLRLGARAAGISGMGPSVAVVVPEDRLPDLKAVLAPTGGVLLVSRFRAPGEVGDTVPHPGGNP